MNYPRHVAIIPDGCRRWAEQGKKLSWRGHEKGIGVLEGLLRFSFKELPIKYITVYGLSVENLDRSAIQLKFLEKLYSRHFLRLAKDAEIHQYEVRVGITGRKDLLPKKLQEAIKVAEEATKGYNKKFFKVALAYSGRQEIVDAAQCIVSSGKKITEAAISKNLYTPDPEPDLIIRTAEKRISNFLLWQSAYSEIFFSEKLWPDFTKEDYLAALEDFSNRKRRFGK